MKQPPLYPDEESRRDRIVIAASRLFAMKGYYGVSMREIADAAKVPLSLIVYHFTAKEKLYRAIFDRFHDIFEARLEILYKIDDFSAHDALYKIVESFVRPVQKAQETEEGRIYALLILREASDPEQERHEIIRDLYDPMARQFIAALHAVMPNKSTEQLAWAYLFTVSALVMSLADARMERLSKGRLDLDYQPVKFNLLIRYICGGLASI